MTALRKYMVYIDDGESCYKVAIPGQTELEAKEYCKGNGEVVAAKDITDEFPIDIGKVCSALRNAHFGEIEISLIERTLTGTRIAD